MAKKSGWNILDAVGLAGMNVKRKRTAEAMKLFDKPSQKKKPERLASLASGMK